MEVDEYARIAAAEDEHWWYRNARAVMADLLQPWLVTASAVLDAGCGPGGNGSWLAAHGRVVGADVSEDALAFVAARRPQTTPVRASLEHLPFADSAFDVAVAITVLYTIDDDARAARELARVTRPGGAVLVMEPAFEWLRRAHDKTVHSRRRYSRRRLARRMIDSGLVVRRASYVSSYLVPPAALLALAERLRPHAAADAGSDVDRRSLDPLFSRIAARERTWLQRHDVPFGTTVAVLATREG